MQTNTIGQHSATVQRTMKTNLAKASSQSYRYIIYDSTTQDQNAFAFFLSLSIITFISLLICVQNWPWHVNRSKSSVEYIRSLSVEHLIICKQVENSVVRFDCCLCSSSSHVTRFIFILFLFDEYPITGYKDAVIALGTARAQEKSKLKRVHRIAWAKCSQSIQLKLIWSYGESNV